MKKRRHRHIPLLKSKPKKVLQMQGRESEKGAMRKKTSSSDLLWTVSHAAMAVRSFADQIVESLTRRSRLRSVALDKGPMR